MKKNHFTNSVDLFSKKMNALRIITVIPFLCFIGAEVLDIISIQKQISEYKPILKIEKSNIEKKLSNMINAGEHCGQANRKYPASPIKSLRNIFNVMDEYTFPESNNWKSNIKLLSKIVNEIHPNEIEAFRDYKQLINISSKSTSLKRYTTAKLKEEIALRSYMYCNGSFGCGLSTYINPIIIQNHSNLELHTYKWDYTSLRPIYSVNGSKYDNNHSFIPTQTGTYYLDVEEKYVQGYQIKTQSHCVEIVVNDN